MFAIQYVARHDQIVRRARQAVGMLTMFAEMVSRMVDAVIPLLESGDITSIEQLEQMMQPQGAPGGFGFPGGVPGNVGPGGR